MAPFIKPKVASQKWDIDKGDGGGKRNKPTGIGDLD